MLHNVFKDMCSNGKLFFLPLRPSKVQHKQHSMPVNLLLEQYYGQYNLYIVHVSLLCKLLSYSVE